MNDLYISNIKNFPWQRDYISSAPLNHHGYIQLVRDIGCSLDGPFTMLSAKKKTSLLKEVVFLLLFGHFFALISMSSESLVDSGCSTTLERVSVTIGGDDIQCGNTYPLSSVDNPTQPGFRFSTEDEVRIKTYQHNHL
jgi:hypothetical protein